LEEIPGLRSPPNDTTVAIAVAAPRASKRMKASCSSAGKSEPGSSGSDPHGAIQARSLAGKINH